MMAGRKTEIETLELLRRLLSQIWNVPAECSSIVYLRHSDVSDNKTENLVVA